MEPIPCQTRRGAGMLNARKPHPDSKQHVF